MRGPCVRSTRPHILPTHSCAADEARRAVIHLTAACCLAARPALRAASACARAGRRVIEPKCPRAVPPRRSRTPAGTLLTDAGPLAYASLAARELSADGECVRWRANALPPTLHQGYMRLRAGCRDKERKKVE
eukprot:CAMPEP_0179872380 /NCGR_PEP_ID=MMETSP0982-20121206/21453_1 /TAXON_ID=483367 /ORGANISM="non described non described, Strain CCMP 2436" /LENGTH=132 /DNA_ID=CAMNT_0021763363 /DNA_START=111 /DNA_END=506 /DNA_ORIENTATION=+